MSNSRRFGLVAVAVVIAIGAFLVLRPTGSSPPEPASTAPGAGASATDRPAAPQYTTINVTQRGGGPTELKVSKGDIVRLAFSADAPAEVHIHGYDREFAVEKGRTVRMSFKANLEGVFEIENHDTEALLAKLRVEP